MLLSWIHEFRSQDRSSKNQLTSAPKQNQNKLQIFSTTWPTFGLFCLFQRKFDVTTPKNGIGAWFRTMHEGLDRFIQRICGKFIELLSFKNWILKVAAILIFHYFYCSELVVAMRINLLWGKFPIYNFYELLFFFSGFGRASRKI